MAHPQTREAVRRILRPPASYAVLKADLLARAAAFMLREFVGDSDDLLDAFKAQLLIGGSGNEPT
jgi:hypothetical protein